MKSLLISLVFTITKSFGQEVELYFKDGCSNTIRKIEFQIVDLTHQGDPIESINSRVVLPFKGSYLVSSSFSKGKKISSFDITIEIKGAEPLVDTLSMPRIMFTTDSTILTNNWNYFYCDKLCDGQEIDFYPNGEKRVEGEFKLGKPIKLIEYRNDGTKERAIWYKVGYLQYERIEYFDKKGKLAAFATFRTTGSETIKRVYDAKGTLLDRQVVNQN